MFLYVRKMYLAGVPIPDRHVLELARRLRATGLEVTGAKLEHAWSAETKVLALDIDDREALLRAREDWCPTELGELRAVLLQEHGAECGTASSS
jgi:hypothetical protein